jgi:3-deoxy-D-manno-octulosonic acid kinase
VPAGYGIAVAADAVLVALPAALPFFGAAVAGAGSLHGWAVGAAGPERLAGRGAVPVADAPCGRVAVRHYRRGGALAALWRDRYPRLGTPRPLRELQASVAARARGIPTPEVVAVTMHPGRWSYRADLATRFIPGAAELAELVFPGGARPPDLLDRCHAAGALGGSLAAAGLYHPDLNLKNILIRTGTAGGGGSAGEPAAGEEVWLVDLDRARVGSGAAGATADARMLARLRRSWEKWERRAGPAPAGAWAALAAGWARTSRSIP